MRGSDFTFPIAAGAVAGLGGSGALLAMQSFDQRYAPRTIAKMNNNALAMQTACGALCGILYGMSRGRGKRRSALRDGILLGAAAYAALGFAKPIWKQNFPQIAGELLRHVAYGVATTAIYGISDAAIESIAMNRAPIKAALTSG